MIEDKLHDLPEGWVWVKFNEVSKKVSLRGKKLKRKLYETDGNIPVIDQGRELIGGYTNKGSMILNCKLPVIVFGDHTKNVKFIDFDFVAGAEGIVVIKTLEALIEKLLFYFIQAVSIPDRGYSRHYQFLEKANIPLPPTTEQYRIVDKIEELFTNLDVGIESLKKVQAQVKRYRQAVLKHAFEGRLTAAWREENKYRLEPVILSPKTYIKQKKIKTQDQSFIDSMRCNLPSGWKLVKLKMLASIVQYGYTAKASREEVGPKFLRITDIQNDKVKWSNVPYCKIDTVNENKYLLDEGDLVFARTGATVGKSYLIGKNVPRSIFASYLIRIKLSEHVSRMYINMFFKSSRYWKQISDRKVGTGQPNVNASKLSHILIPLPPYLEQQKIVEEIERRFSIADRVEEIVDQNLKRAERLRQSILNKAFEGKLVPQDPADEPASVQLERIRAEKEKSDNRKNQRKRSKN